MFPQEGQVVRLCRTRELTKLSECYNAPIEPRKCFGRWTINGRGFRKRVGRLPFTPGENKLQWTTLGGVVFHMPERYVVSDTSASLAGAFTRLDGRRPDEDTLFKNNFVIAPRSGRRLRRYLDSYYAKVRDRLSVYLRYVEDNIVEWHKLAHDALHAKKDLRIRSYYELLRQHNMMTGLFMKNITCKLKIPEFAKMGKNGRIIGDYTCPGSLLAGFLINPLKYAFAERISHAGVSYEFCAKTKVENVESSVQHFLEQESAFLYHSDDSIAKIGSLMANLDISSCDRSNSPAVFERLVWFYERFPTLQAIIQRAVDQCQQPIVIVNPDISLQRAEIIKAKPLFPMEFSGTILTTLLNNIASSAICLSISYHRKHSKCDRLSIERAAAAVGYIVTIDECPSVEHLQFLKNSFYHDDGGQLRSFLNCGSYLRGFGTQWGDYVFNKKKGETLDDAIRYKNWAVLQGFKHAGETSILRALGAAPGCARPRKYDSTVVDRQVRNDLAFKTIGESLRPAVPDSVLCERYGFSPESLHSFCKSVRRLDVGDVMSHEVVRLIMAKDYGYSATFVR